MSGASAGLVGRAPERGLLAELVRSARTGRGGAAVVVGPAGTGKTRLVADIAATSGMTTVQATGERTEASLPGGVLQQLENSLARALDERAAPRSGAASRWSLADWTDRLDRLGPTVLTVDDLQWCDAASREALLHIVRRIENLPVVVLLAMRPWPGAALESCLWAVDTGAATLIELGALEPDEAGRLVRELGPGLSDPDLAATVEEAAGNPQLLVTAAQRRGAEADGEPRLVLSRFTGLEDEALVVASTAAMLTEPVRAADVAELTAASTADADAVLDALFQGGLVHELPGGFGFTHPLLRRLLREELPPALRRRIHAAAYRLARDGGQEQIAADHAVEADLVGDVDAAALLESIGRRALAADSLADAARHLGAAVRCAGSRASTSLQLLLARVLVGVGQTADAAAACRAVLRHPAITVADEVEANTLLGRCLYILGASDRGETHLQRAADRGLAHGGGLGVQPLLDQALAAWLLDGPGRALPLAARARQLAEQAAPSIRERAEASWGYLAYETGDRSGLTGTEPLRRYLADPGELAPLELAWPFAAIFHFGMNANYTERHEDAERAFRVARDTGVRAGMPDALAVVAIYLANLAIRTGDLEAALEEGQEALRLADATPGARAYADLVLAETLSWMGRVDDAQEWLDAARPAVAGNWFGTVWLAHLDGMQGLWRGDANATDTFLEAEKGTRAAGIREPCHIHWGIHAVEAHLAADRLDRARSLVSWLEACAARLPCRWPSIAAASGRGLVAWHIGDLASAERELRAALGLHEGAGLPLHRAEALTTAGRFLRRHGDLSEARHMLQEAVELSVRSGAGSLLRRAGDELRVTEGRRHADQAHELTPGEARVVELAAGGRSNPEIARALHLSVNTVESHLKHAYAKLGISSRRELRARLDPSPT